MINKRLLIFGGSITNILSYSVTPSSISGTSSSTLTHSVTGGTGVTFTLSATGATIHTIGPSGIFSTTTSQGAQGNNASARTLSFTATNTVDGTNTFTDTVAQSAGPVVQQARNVHANASASGTGSQQGGSTFTYSINTNYLPTNEYNLGACYVNINSWYDIFQSTGYQPPGNVPLSVSFSGSAFSGSWSFSGTSIRAPLSSTGGFKIGSITITVGAQPNSNGFSIQVNGNLYVVAQSGWNAGSVVGGSASRSNPLN
jgi:hypothetical protein